MTEFKVGDKVTSDYGDGEIKYGPYTSDFADGVYLVADADGVHRPINVDYLTARPAFEVDDQATWHDELVTIKAGPFPDSDGPRWCVANDEGEYSLAMQEYLSPLPPAGTAEGTGWERVTEDTETINGVTYVMGARYRDRDGDVWKFTRVGDAVRGSCDGTPPDASCTTIITVVDAFGPLTRLTD